MLGRDLGFGPAPAVQTPALVQHPVRHVHRDRRQLKHLMRVVGYDQGKRRVATLHTARAAARARSWGASAPGDARHGPGCPPALRGVAGSGAGGASCRASPTTAAGERSWSSAGGELLTHPTRRGVASVRLQGVDIGLHGKRGLLPVLRGKGTTARQCQRAQIAVP